MSKPFVDVTQQPPGLIDPAVVNPGPTGPFNASPGQPPNPGPGDNPNPHVIPPVPGPPHPGDPPPQPAIPAPPPTTQPPVPPPPRPTMNEQEEKKLNHRDTETQRRGVKKRKKTRNYFSALFSEFFLLCVSVSLWFNFFPS